MSASAKGLDKKALDIDAQEQRPRPLQDLAVKTPFQLHCEELQAAQRECFRVMETARKALVDQLLTDPDEQRLVAQQRRKTHNTFESMYASATERLLAHQRSGKEIASTVAPSRFIKYESVY